MLSRGSENRFSQEGQTQALLRELRAPHLHRQFRALAAVPLCLHRRSSGLHGERETVSADRELLCWKVGLQVVSEE